MRAPVTASEQDLRALAGIVSDERSDLPAQGLPLSLLSELREQIPCDYLSFQGYDSGRQRYWFTQRLDPKFPHRGIPGDDDTVDEAFWKSYWACEVCSYPDRTGDFRSIVRATDFYSVRQYHSTSHYCDFNREMGTEHALNLCLPAPPGPDTGPGRTIRLSLLRGPGPDFTERDRALLTLLRPHIHQAYLDAERRRSPVPDLTPRQWELMRLIAAGCTNVQIARQLGLAEGTVRTHLENIYGRLQVSNRTAAVARAFPDCFA
jgi:DNA-binding CsgD family transcriptional regulator